MKTVLPGRKVVKVYRRAKYGIINFDNGYSIIFHLGMSGSIVIQNQLDFVLGKHDHIIFEFFDKNKIINPTRVIALRKTIILFILPY